VQKITLLFLGKSTKTAATRAALIDSSTHQIFCRLGLCPSGGAYSAPPDRLSCIFFLGGGTSKGRRGERKRERRRVEGREGRRSSFALGRKKGKSTPMIYDRGLRCLVSSTDEWTVELTAFAARRDELASASSTALNYRNRKRKQRQNDESRFRERGEAGQQHTTSEREHGARHCVCDYVMHCQCPQLTSPHHHHATTHSLNLHREMYAIDALCVIS